MKCFKELGDRHIGRLPKKSVAYSMMDVCDQLSIKDTSLYTESGVV